MALAITLLIVVVAGLLAVQWIKPKLAAHRAEEASLGSLYTWKASGKFNIDVVGESFYKEALSTLLGSDKERHAVAVLVPYVNDKDDNAVRVEIKGQIVGHLSRSEAREFRQLLATKHKALATSCCKALIGGGAPKPDGARGPIGVRLDIAELSL